MKRPHSFPVRIILLVLLGGCFIWALVSLVQHFLIPTAELRDLQRTEKELVGATLAPSPTAVTQASLSEPEGSAEALPSPAPVTAATMIPKPDPVTGAMPELLPDYVYLYAVNSDMGGWLRVRAIPRIDFAWVRGKNAFYIHKDFYGRESAGGTAFLDESCTDWPRDPNLIIYAHNLKSGDMFGELHRLSEASLLASNPLIDFDTLYEKGVYVPVSVCVCDINPGTASYFDFNVPTFPNEAAFDAFVNRARELNLVRYGADAKWGDRLLTLVTCFDDANQQRFLVIARELRVGETEESAVSAFFR